MEDYRKVRCDIWSVTPKPQVSLCCSWSAHFDRVKSLAAGLAARFTVKVLHDFILLRLDNVSLEPSVCQSKYISAFFHQFVQKPDPDNYK